MDLNKNKVDILTGHFQHSGFTRTHAPPSGDPLLLGPSYGTPYPLQREVSYSFLWLKYYRNWFELYS